MFVELVHVKTADGVRLDGALRKPSETTESVCGVDIMILHHGVGGNFYQHGFFGQFSELLLGHGCAVLQVNNRGHDLVNQAVVQPSGHAAKLTRMGAAYEDVAACRLDLESWVEMAYTAGFRRIGLWGHSLGAAKTIHFMAAKHDDRVSCVIAASPPRFSFENLLAADESRSFRADVAQAEDHVRQGNPEALMEIRFPIPLLITARTFLQKYGPLDECDILPRLTQLKVATLILIGTAEAQSIIGFQGLPEKVALLAAQTDVLTFISVDGADHFYSNQRNEVWRIVRSWLADVTG